MGRLEYLAETEEHRHIPVLITEVIQGLAVVPGGHYLDATIGGGGHAQAILQASAPDGQLLGLDRDPEAVIRTRRRLARFGSRLKIVQTSYDQLLDISIDDGFLPVDGALFDLGFSSWQIEDASRGFSHRLDGPLDMRYDPGGQGPTAEEMINTLPETDLANLIWRYGEEKQSRRIARAIVTSRPVKSSSELANIVANAVTHRYYQRLHPATRTFQAIRIAVNDELAILEQTLPQVVASL
ncbi:MAG: 16S rRNA (cytosine(1402)-N(4))-methyltransferase RsmH, partial [Anaerolineae bacterium]|nr:16S rRNA (cytosine(1402)-N(4))-methyltransferase RsmH [Anaerolineae bacterium]